MIPKEYHIQITRTAEKDIKKLTPKLKKKLYDILTEVVAKNPFEGKKLIGDLEGSYSLRLSYKDRVLYSIDEKKKVVYIERARTHYNN